MKKAIGMMVLITVASFLIFSLAFSQEEKTTSVADTTKKEEVKQEATTKPDTTKPAATATKDTTKAGTKVVHKYFGTTKCKMCHNTDAKGKIHDKWAASGHAKAYQTLLSEAAKGIAKKMGIEDASKSDKCLKCHVTGYKEASGDKYSMEEGVTCEACHGPGEHYWTMTVMKNKKVAMENGLVIPTEKDCIKCHNKDSPTYKEFKFADAYKLVEHHVPKVAPAIEKK